jgi:sensor histidine kinase YesM
VIENAIIHGLFPKKTEGNIFITYTLNPDGKSITCEIRDDGVGRGALSDPFRSSHQSKGTMLTEQRLEYLSKKYNLACSIQITDLLDDNGGPMGTLVAIVIPILEKNE